MRDEFLAIVKACKFQAENEEGQERSVVSMQNQREVFKDEDLLAEGLGYIKS